MLKEMLTPMAVLAILAILDSCIIIGLVALGLGAVLAARDVVWECRAPRLALAIVEAVTSIRLAGGLGSRLARTCHVLRSAPGWAMIELCSGAAAQLVRGVSAPSGTKHPRRAGSASPALASSPHV